MNKLELDSIKQTVPNLSPFQKILNEVGQEIHKLTNGHFYHAITTSDMVKMVTLYLYIPQIGYDYRIISISKKYADLVDVHFYTLDTNDVKMKEVSTKTNYDDLEKAVYNFLNSAKAKEIFRILIEEVKESISQKA